MGAAFPVRVWLPHETKICFVDKDGWLKGLGNSLSPEITGSKTAEFAVDQRRQLIESTLVALRPPGKKTCYLVTGRHTGKPGNSMSVAARVYTSHLRVVTSIHEKTRAYVIGLGWDFRMYEIEKPQVPLAG